MQDTRKARESLQVIPSENGTIPSYCRMNLRQRLMIISASLDSVVISARFYLI
jgi:hypothetical protein